MARPASRSGWLAAPSRLDLVVAVGATVVVALGTMLATTLQDGVRAPGAGAAALVAVAALALSWRRTAPTVVLTVVVAAVAAYILAGYPFGPIQLCMVFAMFEVARLRPMRTSLLACGVAVVAATGALLIRAGQDAAEPLLLATVWASWLVVPWSLGALVRVRSAATERSRQELAARSALEERIRVAREVHDVAGHGFAAVAMQAGVALLVLDEQPEQVKASLEAIQSTSTKALADLRTMLDAVHRRTGAADGTQGPDDVIELVEQVRAAGVPVQLSLDTVAVPEEIERVAYRVIQEALTNVLRHAGPANAQVSVRRDHDTLVVEVLDNGIGAAQVRPGRGLTGMRGRVVAAGGELVAGPRAGSGFRVSARLPLGGPG